MLRAVVVWSKDWSVVWEGTDTGRSRHVGAAIVGIVYSQILPGIISAHTDTLIHRASSPAGAGLGRPRNEKCMDPVAGGN